MNEGVSHNCLRVQLRKSFMIAVDFSNPINTLKAKISISFLYMLRIASTLCLIHLHLSLKYKFQT